MEKRYFTFILFFLILFTADAETPEGTAQGIIINGFSSANYLVKKKSVEMAKYIQKEKMYLKDSVYLITAFILTRRKIIW